MAKLINQSEGNFTKLNNVIVWDYRLETKHRGMLATLISLPNNWEFSVAGLMTVVPDGHKKIDTILKDLEALGYLARKQKKLSNGQFGSSDYEITIPDLKEIKELSATLVQEKKSKKHPVSETAVTESAISASAEADESITPSANNIIDNKVYNTYVCNTDAMLESIDQSSAERQTEAEIRTYLSELFGYEALMEDSIAVDLFDLCVELLSNKATLKVGGSEIPFSALESRIYKLNCSDLLRIANNVRNYDKPIYSHKKFLAMSLYNERLIFNTATANSTKVANQTNEASLMHSFDIQDFYEAAVACTEREMEILYGSDNQANENGN